MLTYITHASILPAEVTIAVDRTLSSFIKRDQQPIFIGILLFLSLVYPCHSFFAGMVRHEGNRQNAQYPGPQNTTCHAFIRPLGSIRAGKSAKLEIEEPFCDRQPSLPALPAATITRVDASSYEVSFVPQHKGSLEFTFQSVDGSSTPYTYKYKADPAPIAAILLEVIVLAPAIALLIVLVRNRIRAAKEELRNRAETAALHGR